MIMARIYVEKLILKHMVEAMLAQGYSVTLTDEDGDTLLKESRDLNTIMANAMQGDEDLLHFHKAGTADIGYVSLVYGNCGTDVISDYSANLEAALASTLAFVDRIEKGLV